MRNIFLSFTLLLLVVKSFCQPPTSHAISKDYYLKKSKNQNTIGWILLGTGVALKIVGIAQKDSVNILFGGNVKNNDDVAFYILGAVSTVSSIPFFIASAKNKRKAMAATVGFNNQKILFPQQNGLVLKTQPTLILKISL